MDNNYNNNNGYNDQNNNDPYGNNSGYSNAQQNDPYGSNSGYSNAQQNDPYGSNSGYSNAQQNDPYGQNGYNNNQQNPYGNNGYNNQQDPYGQNGYNNNQQNPYGNPYQAPDFYSNINREFTDENAGKATASMVLGIISLVACCLPIAGYPVSIIGLVLGIKSKDSLTNGGKAKAGIIMSAIGLGLTILSSIYGVVSVMSKY